MRTSLDDGGFLLLRGDLEYTPGTHDAKGTTVSLCFSAYFQIVNVSARNVLKMMSTHDRFQQLAQIGCDLIIVGALRSYFIGQG